MKHYLITLIDPRTKIHHTVPIETEGGSFGEIISATEQEGSMTFQRWSDMTVRSIEQIDEDEYEDYSRNS